MDEFGLGHAGRYPGQGCLARSGRSPKEHGKQTVLFDGFSESLTRPQYVLLSHEFVQIKWSHAVCKGSCLAFVIISVKQVHYDPPQSSDKSGYVLEGGSTEDIVNRRNPLVGMVINE
jgi:hypothetical protein